MKIGIIGSGMVGQALAAGFAAKGHDVVIGTREAAKLADWQAGAGKGVRIGSLAEVGAHGEVLFLATQWGGTENALKLAGDIAGKVLVDVTNPLSFEGGKPGLALGHSDSGGEQVQRWAPSARVVKALNIVTASTMVSPRREDGDPDMFIGGDDPAAKATVTTLLQGFGWSVIDLGGIDASRLLEPLALIWIKLYFATKNGQHAFKLLRK
jgi:predicted dinucleotide-binding enzyme